MSEQTPIDDGGYAFPSGIAADSMGGLNFSGHFQDCGGMSLRDYFAGQAIQSCLSASSSGDGCYDYVAAAIGAYAVADALLSARQQEKA